MESARKHLTWRLKNLLPSLALPFSPTSPQSEPYIPPRTIHLLPSTVLDPFGRPILIIRISRIAADILENSTDDFRTNLVFTLDRLRIHLKDLNQGREDERLALQFVMLLDLEGVGIQSFVSFSFFFFGYVPFFERNVVRM
jgi:hypothetical protein